MSLYDNISLAQARKDLAYLRNTYEVANDFCGSFCNTEVLEDLLFGRTSIKRAIISNIEYYFTNGLEEFGHRHGCTSDVLPDENDKRVQEIKERYYID